MNGFTKPQDNAATKKTDPTTSKINKQGSMP